MAKISAPKLKSGADDSAYILPKHTLNGAVLQCYAMFFMCALQRDTGSNANTFGKWCSFQASCQIVIT